MTEKNQSEIIREMLLEILKNDPGSAFIRSSVVIDGQVYVVTIDKQKVKK